MKSKRLLFLAALLGIATSVLIFFYLEGLKTSIVNVETGEVLVARQDIPARTLITSDMLEVARVPRNYIHPQAISKLDTAAGGVTVSPIVQGEQLLRSQVVRQQDSRADLAYRIPPGKRAVSIPIDDISGVSGFPRVGDHVDVIGTVTIPVPGPSGQEVQRVFTVVALQDIEILAVGQSGESSGGSAVKKQGGEKQTATLAVTLAQAQPLVMASERGSIRLLLRSPVEQGTVPTNPFELRDLLKAGTQNGPALPQASPTGPESR